MNVNQNSRILADELAAILDEHKGQDIVLIDIEKYSVVADGFLLVSGRNTPQVQALADALEAAAKVVDRIDCNSTINNGTHTMRVQITPNN